LPEPPSFVPGVPEAGFAPGPPNAPSAPSAPNLIPPSLLWKAYALAMRPKLSLAPDLSALNQAMFLASPLQAGIPANSVVPEGVTNYQQYLKADRMQIKNQPFYSLENDSYFETLWE
jgi:hypothetical protein